MKTEDTEKQKVIDNFHSLIKRTNKENPKAEDIEELQEALEIVPNIYRQNGNLQKQILRNALDQATGKSGFIKETTTRYIKEMKENLGYFAPATTFVEKMLIDEIIMRWIRLQSMEQNHINSTTGQHSMREGEYVEKRLHLTQKRFLQSIETLAKVRKMIASTQAKGAEMFKNLVDAREKQDSKLTKT